MRAALLVTAAAAVTISGAAEKPETPPPVSVPPAVSPAALLPPGTVPDAPRDTFDVATALSTSDRPGDGTGCADVTHGRLLRPGDAGQGFQSAAAGGQVSELVARTVRPVDLTAWAQRARRCGRITVDDPQGTAVSSVTVRPGPAVPDAKTLSYEQVLTLPGQPPSCRDCACAPSPSPPTTYWSCSATPEPPTSTSTPWPSPRGSTRPRGWADSEGEPHVPGPGTHHSAACLRHWAAVKPDEVALTHVDYRDSATAAQSLTWRELDERVGRSPRG